MKHSFPTRRSSDLLLLPANRAAAAQRFVWCLVPDDRSGQLMAIVVRSCPGGTSWKSMHRDGDTPRPRRDAETSRHRGSVASDIKIANGGKRALRGRKTASDLLQIGRAHV